MFTLTHTCTHTDVRDEAKRTHFCKKTEKYLARAEKVKEAAASEKANICTHKQVGGAVQLPNAE